MKKSFWTLVITFLFLTASVPAALANDVYYEGEGYITPTSKSQAPFILSEAFNSGNKLKVENFTSSNRVSQLAVNKMITVNPLATNFPDIVLYTTVLDSSGNPISGLSKNDFIVKEQSDKEDSPVLENITNLKESEAERSRISFSLVFDLSGSMEGSRLEDAQAAANSFMNNTAPKDRGSLVVFSSGGSERIVLKSGLISNDENNNGESDIVDVINSLSAGGRTAVYDGTAKGIESLNQEPSPKAVIVFTDGATNSDRSYNINTVIKKANNEGVPLYTIGLGIDPQNLKDMAAATGGAYYYAPTAQDMAAIYNSIAQSVRSQYEIGYTSHNPEFDGTVRTVTVEVGGNSNSGIYVVNSKPSIDIDTATVNLMNQSHPENVNIPLSGSIVDQDAKKQGQPLSAFLFYRHKSESDYHKKALDLIEQGSGVYSYDTFIEKQYISEPYVEFFLHVTDEIQNTYLPFNYTEYPFTIAVLPNHAPEISHQTPGGVQAGQPVTISVEIDDSDIDKNDSITDVILSYRIIDLYQQTPYVKLNMDNDGGTNFSAVIPGGDILAPGVEYYISAWDSFNTRSDFGSSDQPNLISIEPDIIEPVVPEPIAPEPAAPEKSISISDQTKNDKIGINWNQGHVFTWDSTGIDTVKIVIYDGPAVAGQESLVYIENIENTGSWDLNPGDFDDIFKQTNSNLYFYVGDTESASVYDHGQSFHIYGVPDDDDNSSSSCFIFSLKDGKL